MTLTPRISIYMTKRCEDRKGEGRGVITQGFVVHICPAHLIQTWEGCHQKKAINNCL